MRHAIYVPPFGQLADPHAIVDIACATEQAGWDGFFLWDHVLIPVAGDWEISDPWVALAAAAVATRQIRLGPMVTALPRRRVIKLARETVTLDRLCRGRLVLGLGIGSDRGREYSAFGDDPDPRRLGQALDEGVEVLTGLWSGNTVTHHGAPMVDDVSVVPGPVQQPRIPLWFGTERTTGKPIERAAKFDGIFPLNVDADGVRRIAENVETIRGNRTGFDIAVVAVPGDDLDSYRAAGATWAMHAFWPGHRPDQVLRAINRGKPS